jgi:hypothetical protein
MLRVNEDHGARRPVSKPLTFEKSWTEHFVPSMKTRALAPRTVIRIPGAVGLYLAPSIAQRRFNEFHAPDLNGEYRWFGRRV